MKRSRLLFTSVILMAICLPGQAAQIIINFDDLTNVPADGLTDQGILYNFDVGGLPSSAAIYGAAFPSDSLIGSTVLLGPAGNAAFPSLFGSVSLSFLAPVDYLSFAIALNSAANDSFKIHFFDPFGNAETPLLVSTAANPGCDPNASVCFSEARYVYSGPSLIGKAQLDFANTQADTFALSTLVYDAPGGPGGSQTPEPGSTFLMSGGVVAFVAAAKWRYRPSRFSTKGAN